MPVSKSGKLYFTEVQYKVAKAYSALAYAREAGYELVKHSANSYHLRQHDSMIFTLDGRWFWKSKNVSGRALELLQYYEGLTLPEAVNVLTAGNARSAAPPSEPPPQKPFELPEKSPTFKRLFSYLCNTRGLDEEIIQELVRQRRIYEGIRKYNCAKTGDVRIAHNVVFVGFDEQGRPKSAFQRGTNSKAAFKRDVAGSEKKYAFILPGQDNSTKVSVFEASIDAISHATLAKINGMDWRDRDRLALGGVASTPLLYYLNLHPQRCQIELCLDNDLAGLHAADIITTTLQEWGYTENQGYIISRSFPWPKHGKDWNDELLHVRQELKGKGEFT